MSAPDRPRGSVLGDGEETPLTRRRFLGAAVVSSAAVLGALAPTSAQAKDGGEEALSRVRRWGMVIDLRRCDGCVGVGLPPQCAQFCYWSRFVPEGQEWLEVHEQEAGEFPGGPRQFFPMLCMQCENAPCVNVCPVGATFHAPEGTVLIDQERCIGCRLCMAACPYDRRFFNWRDPAQPDWVRERPYDVRTQIPAMRGTVMKCDFCTERVSAGGLPPCVLGCPQRAFWFGDLEEDIATNGSDIVRFSHLIHHEGAFRHKEKLGTQPRVFYIQGHGQDARRTTDNLRFFRDRLEWSWTDSGGMSWSPDDHMSREPHGVHP